MTIIDRTVSLVRYIQGERRGMGSELRQPAEMLVTLSNFLLPSIVIETLVRIADVSFWQDLIDFVVMKAAGISGVIVRAGQRTWVDSKFKENWAKAKAAGLPRGSYWFYDSRQDPKKQAALWWSLLEEDVGELVHVADFEESYGGEFGDPSHFEQFILEFQRLSGLPDSRIAIYTGHFWWAERVGNDNFFRRFALWLAWYADMDAVRVPRPWVESDLLFWQYTASGNGNAYGVSSKEIDLNWYSSDQISFARRFGLGTVPPTEPPTGETMLYGKVLVGLNIRPTPGTTQNPIGQLKINDLVEAVINSSGWWKLSKITRGGQNIALPATDCWAYEGATNGYIQPIAPPGDVVPVKLTGVLEMSDGSKYNYEATNFTKAG